MIWRYPCFGKPVYDAFQWNVQLLCEIAHYHVDPFSMFYNYWLLQTPTCATKKNKSSNEASISKGVSRLEGMYNHQQSFYQSAIQFQAGSTYSWYYNHHLFHSFKPYSIVKPHVSLHYVLSMFFEMAQIIIC